MNEAELEELLSRPSPHDVAAMRELPGDILVLGVSGKMGPSLARLARRASDGAGMKRRIVGVARFSSREVRAELEQSGIETAACDLLDRAALASLPTLPNVVYMAGQKFGTSSDQATTWAINVQAAALAAERFAESRIVAFSTGNVYPLTSPQSGGPGETDPTGPIGEYAQSTLGRERILEYASRRSGTKMAIIRLNYAVEPRYGVLRDIADKVVRGEPIDLGMGYVNLIWQRDANSVALRTLARCESPPLVLNVTGPEVLSVRDLAARIGTRLGLAPRFSGAERKSALLSKAAKMAQMFGAPGTSLDAMLDMVAGWVKGGGRALGKPTHFEEREGKF
ncbi:MAG TPA: NAD(P)-dependent oxidoreductase [Gemmatimonadales bacterium]|jgi:nucleoside-diphosphate-sugar epimerase